MHVFLHSSSLGSLLSYSVGNCHTCTFCHFPCQIAFLILINGAGFIVSDGLVHADHFTVVCHRMRSVLPNRFPEKYEHFRWGITQFLVHCGENRSWVSPSPQHLTDLQLQWGRAGAVTATSEPRPGTNQQNLWQPQMISRPSCLPTEEIYKPAVQHFHFIYLQQRFLPRLLKWCHPFAL